MIRREWVGAVLLMGLCLVGCQDQPPPAPVQAPPVSPARFVELRNLYVKNNPNARVGMVTAVLPASNLAAVGNVNVLDFSTGDVITFVDSEGNQLTIGNVVSIVGDRLHVKYEDPHPPARAPMAGDLAVRLIR